MTTYTLSNDSLTVSVVGLDMLWALRSSITVPLSHIVSVESAQKEAKEWLIGIKIGGTHLPGVISAGTFWNKQGRVFWDVHHAQNAIKITLQNESYIALMIEVEHPEEAIQMIQKALHV